MPELQIDLEVFPHQKAFIECPKRYAIVCSGTKAGKSIAGAIYAAKMFTSAPRVRGVWVAPTHSQSVGIGLENVRALLPREYVVEKASGITSIRFRRLESIIEFKSADEPDNLFGAKADFAVLDEAGRISEDAFTAVRTTLTATRGPLRLLSNPTPRMGWFFRLYSRGLDPDDSDVASFRWRTADNTLIPREEIEDARRTLSERTFRSLYEGEFLDVGGSVFLGVRECAVGSLKEPRAGGIYVGGLDLARTVDFSVATVIDAQTRDVVAWERWHGNSWEASVSRVAALAHRYNGARFIVDSTGLGDPVLEQLERAGVRVEGFRFSSTTKAQLVEGLAAAVEKREITFPPIEVLLGELEAFEGHTGPNGVVRYGAPGSDHDDAVISLALAVHALNGMHFGPLLSFVERAPRVIRGVF